MCVCVRVCVCVCVCVCVFRVHTHTVSNEILYCAFVCAFLPILCSFLDLAISSLTRVVCTFIDCQKIDIPNIDV